MKYWVMVGIVTPEKTIERIQILIECNFREQSHVIAESKLQKLGLSPSGDMFSRKHGTAIELQGGVMLSPDGAVKALNQALPIIESIGTTGIYSQYANARQWMDQYFPNYVS